MLHPRSIIFKIGLFITCVYTAVSTPVSAQALPPATANMITNMAGQAKNDPTTLISLNEYGSFIQAVSGPFSLPGVISTSFQANRGTLGNGEFTRLVAPISHSFDNLEFDGFTPYAEVTFSFTDQKQSELWMEGMPIQMMVEHNIKTTSIMTGVGVDFELMKGLTIRPLVHLGWSRIKDRSNQVPTTNVTMTMMQQMFRNLTGDGIFKWEVDQFQYGPAVETKYNTNAGDDIEVNLGLRFTQLNIKTISTSTPGLEESSKFHSLSGNLELDGPTSVNVSGWDMRWQYFMGATRFDTATKNALKFSWLGEVGAGLFFVDSQEDSSYVETVGFSGSLIVGDNDVDGWTIGAKATF
jgi:hypothetical protein